MPYDELVKRLRNCATQAAPCRTCGLIEDGSCSDTLMKQAADAIEKLQKAVIRLEDESGILDELPMYEQPVGWIPVAERLPDAGERVLCYCRANIYEVMKMRTDGDWVYDTNHVYMHSFVTHWMPLPEPPKEE